MMTAEREPVNTEFAAVLDIGGTWTRAALVSCTGELVARERVRTPQRADVAHYLDRCARLLRTVAGARPIRGVGVSVTGPVDPGTGVLYTPPNTGGWLAGARIGPLLRQRLGLPVCVDRDTNCALLGELHCGAARGAGTAVYLTFSTGVGGAVVIDGALLRGAAGVAGELGHVCVRPGGPPCGCGRTGCLEAIAAGPAIVRAALAALGTRGTGPLAETIRAVGGPQAISGEHVSTAAALGDLAAMAALGDARAAVCSAAVDLANTFNPERIVLGGAVIRSQTSWIAAAAEAVRTEAMTPARQALVVAAELGDDGGLLGAALAVFSSTDET